MGCKSKEEEKAPVALPEPGETYYYAEKSQTDGIPGYSFRFASVSRGQAEAVSGIEVSAPNGTDGMRSSFKGVLDTVSGVLRTETTFLAEGERTVLAKDYQILDSTLAYVREDRSVDTTYALPEVSAERYEQILKEYQQQGLRMAVNTDDRSRLKNVAELRSVYSEEELENVRFVERYADLDNDNETQEYLLMVLDPMFCGSGGCNLFIINEKGEVLSNTTVADLPIYTALQTAEETQARKGQYNALFVWSNGSMRRLVANDEGTYTANASMAEEMPEEVLKAHPEKYRLVLDFME